MAIETEKKLQRVRIVSEDGIGYKSKVVDADTGEMLPGVFRVDVSIDVHHVNKAVIHTHRPIVDVLAEAEVHTYCPYCKHEIEQEKAS